MSHAFFVGATFLVFLVLSATATEAQEQPLMPVIGVGAGVSMEDGSSGISSGIAPGLSGRSAAWDWLIGLNVSRRVAVVFEASEAAAYKKEQGVPRGSTRFERTHQDAIYSAMLRFQVHDRLTVVSGISRVRFETTELRFELRRPTPSSPPVVEGPFRGPDHSGWSTGAVIGFDFLPLHWRLITAGPAVRVFIYDHLDEGLSPHFGYGHYAVRVGGRVQTRF